MEDEGNMDTPAGLVGVVADEFVAGLVAFV